MRKMHIDAQNHDEIRKVYLHDAWFSGFDYNFAGRLVTMDCIQPQREKRIHLVFSGVINIDMQSCGFWGEGNSVVGIGLGETDKLVEYKRMCGENPVLNADLLDDAEYMNVELEINSGAVLSILCAALEVYEAECTLGNLIRPHGNKRLWEDCAKYICMQSDEELRKHLPGLFEWLQDMSWPGAQRIAARLRRFSYEMIQRPLDTAIERAQKEYDEEWKENLLMMFDSYQQRDSERL